MLQLTNVNKWNIVTKNNKWGIGQNQTAKADVKTMMRIDGRNEDRNFYNNINNQEHGASNMKVMGLIPRQHTYGFNSVCTERHHLLGDHLK